MISDRSYIIPLTPERAALFKAPHNFTLDENIKDKFKESLNAPGPGNNQHLIDMSLIILAILLTDKNLKKETGDSIYDGEYTLKERAGVSPVEIEFANNAAIVEYSSEKKLSEKAISLDSFKLEGNKVKYSFAGSTSTVQGEIDINTLIAHYKGLRNFRNQISQQTLFSVDIEPNARGESFSVNGVYASTFKQEKLTDILSTVYPENNNNAKIDAALKLKYKNPIAVEDKVEDKVAVTLYRNNHIAGAFYNENFKIYISSQLEKIDKYIADRQSSKYTRDKSNNLPNKLRQAKDIRKILHTSLDYEDLHYRLECYEKQQIDNETPIVSWGKKFIGITVKSNSELREIFDETLEVSKLRQKDSHKRILTTPDPIVRVDKQSELIKEKVKLITLEEKVSLYKTKVSAFKKKYENYSEKISQANEKAEAQAKIILAEINRLSENTLSEQKTSTQLILDDEISDLKKRAESKQLVYLSSKDSVAEYHENNKKLVASGREPLLLDKALAKHIKEYEIPDAEIKYKNGDFFRTGGTSLDSITVAFLPEKSTQQLIEVFGNNDTIQKAISALKTEIDELNSLNKFAQIQNIEQHSVISAKNEAMVEEYENLKREIENSEVFKFGKNQEVKDKLLSDLELSKSSFDDFYFDKIVEIESTRKSLIEKYSEDVLKNIARSTSREQILLLNIMLLEFDRDYKKYKKPVSDAEQFERSLAITINNQIDLLTQYRNNSTANKDNNKGHRLKAFVAASRTRRESQNLLPTDGRINPTKSQVFRKGLQGDFYDFNENELADFKKAVIERFVLLKQRIVERMRTPNSNFVSFFSSAQESVDEYFGYSADDKEVSTGIFESINELINLKNLLEEIPNNYNILSSTRMEIYDDFTELYNEFGAFLNDKVIGYLNRSLSASQCLYVEQNKALLPIIEYLAKSGFYSDIVSEEMVAQWRDYLSKGEESQSKSGYFETLFKGTKECIMQHSGDFGEKVVNTLTPTTNGSGSEAKRSSSFP